MNLAIMLKEKNALNATLLITGCCIGAGMIGMPVMSALAGFMPASLAMLFCYFFTTFTGLLLLEATLWFDREVNLPSISEFALGIVGRAITLILFLFLFYSLFVAYLDAGGQLFAEILNSLFNLELSREAGIFICAFVAALLTYVETKIFGGLNRYLFFGLIITYFILVFIGFPLVRSTNLAHVNWTEAIATVPILLICFGYQNLVPSLTYYLNKNVNAIRFAIIVGNLIPFFIYFIWNFIILGMLSPTDIASKEQITMVTTLLQNANDNISVLAFVKAFSLFAMFTSFLPSAISFIDFLKDGLKYVINREQRNKNLAVLFVTVFLPPIIFTLFYSHLFLKALNFAGGFIDVLLFGITPALVVLVGRNIKKMTGPYQVIGGNFTPIAVLFFSLIILFLKF